MGTPRKRGGGGPDAGVSFMIVTLPRTDAVRKVGWRSGMPSGLFACVLTLRCQTARYESTGG
ncbi:hypothetical protein CH298_02205 [Rhodococcoides fascians]|nr:hypothetical protein CH303_02205 [Rhodococcus fascians]OZF23014.1 hypothetical protein CH298_02205 [Rhodococcus fascians]OZF24728.1 hypothetical protein CH297_02205 [Rhodococcus fascians]OZF72977.1 hypothetical protein CH308_02210 [Rhodococcus fascians]OZF74142.1 hypothetical protein CH307_02205 [Rhodococcus fascians]